MNSDTVSPRSGGQQLNASDVEDLSTVCLCQAGFLPGSVMISAG